MIAVSHPQSPGQSVIRVRPAVFLILLLSSLLSSDLLGLEQIPIYTQSNAPSAPLLKDLPLKRQVTQHEITWTFAAPARVGQFINGDYYVVGPVTITDIDPRPQGGRNVRNGSMLNPPASPNVAYDSDIKNFFNANLLATPPISMRPGDTLVSSISVGPSETVRSFHSDALHRRGRHDDSPVKRAAILTCVPSPLPLDAFRPAFTDRRNHLFFSRDLKRDSLLRLRPVGEIPSIDEWAGAFQRPWINMGSFGFDHPMENMPHYGQQLAEVVSIGSLLLMLDIPQQRKERLLVNMVQVGIDYGGAVLAGHPGWEAHGGHGSGRKFLIVFAGLMLGEKQLARISHEFPKAEFAEDSQTMYGPTWTGSRVAFAGHSGIQKATGVPNRPHWGPYEHLHPSQWDAENLRSDSYRKANTSGAWVGYALALRLLKAEEDWDWPPFFDYVDRWMMEDNLLMERAKIRAFVDNPHLVGRVSGMRGGWMARDGNWGGHRPPPFVHAMWEHYRPQIPAAADAWKAGDWSRRVANARAYAELWRSDAPSPPSLRPIPIDTSVASSPSNEREDTRSRQNQVRVTLSLRPSSPDDNIVNEWEGKTLTRLIELVQAGKKPAFSMHNMEMSVTEIDENQVLRVSSRNMNMNLPYGNLDQESKASLAISMANTGGEEIDHALAAFWLLLRRQNKQATKHLGRLNTSLAQEVRNLFLDADE